MNNFEKLVLGSAVADLLVKTVHKKTSNPNDETSPKSVDLFSASYNAGAEIAEKIGKNKVLADVLGSKGKVLGMASILQDFSSANTSTAKRLGDDIALAGNGAMVLRLALQAGALCVGGTVGAPVITALAFVESVSTISSLLMAYYDFDSDFRNYVDHIVEDGLPTSSGGQASTKPGDWNPSQGPYAPSSQGNWSKPSADGSGDGNAGNTGSTGDAFSDYFSKYFPDGSPWNPNHHPTHAGDSYGNPYAHVDPVVITLPGGEDAALGLSYFDFDGDGFAEQTYWTSDRQGLLVLDRNGDASVGDGGELFGDYTILTNGKLAKNGFQALKDFDGNHDGRIDASDDVWQSLKVWMDDGDGETQSGELKTLSELGIEALVLSSPANRMVDAAGNMLMQFMLCSSRAILPTCICKRNLPCGMTG